MRREPKVGGVATFEAIARAFGILESYQVQKQLEQFFHNTMEANRKGEQGAYYSMRKQNIEAEAIKLR